jgi:hypothetical protein
VEFKLNEDIVSVLYVLLPGFTAAWVFYAFTAYKKASPFERTVQALIFTGFTILLADPSKHLLIWIGTHYRSYGSWTEKSSVSVGMVLGLIVGVFASWLANNNLLHRLCSKVGITKRTSYSSEWYSVFHRAKHSFVYLNYKDGRRVYGWAEQYPDDPKEGHFVLTHVAYPTEAGFEFANSVDG